MEAIIATETRTTLRGVLLSIGTMLLKVVLVFYLPVAALLTVLHFPRDTDPSDVASALAGKQDSQAYYAKAFEPQREGPCTKDSLYAVTAKEAAQNSEILKAVQKFVADYRLSGKKILEVGSGSGSLQDVVDDYTGLDISSTVAPLYHKPFVLASATSMPIPDGAFDAIWTVWVLEHVAEPEKMLHEMRRVLKPGGLLFLHPAWNCAPWASQGYEVRPYRDLDIAGRVAKAAIPVRKLGSLLARHPVRLVRLLEYKLMGHRTRLRYHALTPNYNDYWVADSDAAVSLDPFEVYLWFKSRGDECLNCSGTLSDTDHLILRVDKRNPARLE